MSSVASLADVLPLPEAPERGALFIMSPATVGAAAAIQYMYPGPDLIVQRDVVSRTWWFDDWWPIVPAGDPPISAAFYPVDRATAERPRLDPPWGLELEYDTGEIHHSRHDPYPFYAFLKPSFSRPLDVVWRGQVTIPPPGGYRIEPHAFAQATMWIDGRLTTATDALPAGTHTLAIELKDLREPVLFELFWQPAGQSRVLIPPSALSPPVSPPPG
jgi:hypothetical protein